MCAPLSACFLGLCLLFPFSKWSARDAIRKLPLRQGCNGSPPPVFSGIPQEVHSAPVTLRSTPTPEPERSDRGLQRSDGEGVGSPLCPGTLGGWGSSQNRPLVWSERRGGRALTTQTLQDGKQLVTLEGTLGTMFLTAAWGLSSQPGPGQRTRRPDSVQCVGCPHPRVFLGVFEFRGTESPQAPRT